VSRFGRQSKLAEVGSAGQDKIARSDVDVRVDGLAGDVAVRYLAGAGFRRLRVRDASLIGAAQAIDPEVVVRVDGQLGPTVGDAPRELLEQLGVRDDAALQVARGAYAALRALRAALGLEP
jgi:hypothetical protein